MTLARPVFAVIARFWYLALTPAFALLDYAAGIDLRVSLLDGHPRVRAAYYVVAFGCGVASLLRPYAARAIALAESAANVVLLLVGLATWLIDDARAYTQASDEGHGGAHH